MDEWGMFVGDAASGRCSIGIRSTAVPHWARSLPRTPPGARRLPASRDTVQFVPDRRTPLHLTDEKGTLLDFLGYLRESVILKVDRLDEEAVRRSSVPTGTNSPRVDQAPDDGRSALGLTLAASVRRRRRDLALLKALGFTRPQLAVTIAWQASIAALVGIIVGVPVGIALGRWLWDLFARGIYVVPVSSVPVVEVVVVALGALVLANLVAAIPGRMAARTPTALVLRAE